MPKGGTYPVRSAMATPATRWDLLPGGAKVKGAVIFPPTRTGATDGFSRVADCFAKWNDPTHPGNWANIQAQIDQAKALGCNLVRFHATQNGRAGSGGPYPDTPVSDAAYFAAWEQFFNYVRAQGMFAYPVLGGMDSAMIDGGNGWSYTPTTAWFKAEALKLVGYFERHIDIIPGIDISVESTTWATTVENSEFRGQTLYKALKAAVPRFRYTWSHNYSTTAGSTPPQAPGAWDYLDYHIYYDAAAADFDALVAAANNPVVIGEFGRDSSAGDAARQSRYNAVLGVVNNVGNAGTGFRRVAGAVVWTARDYGPSGGNQWGLADISGSVRSDVSSIWATFPTS